MDGRPAEAISGTFSTASTLKRMFSKIEIFNVIELRRIITHSKVYIAV